MLADRVGRGVDAGQSGHSCSAWTRKRREELVTRLDELGPHPDHGGGVQTVGVEEESAGGEVAFMEELADAATV